MRVQLKRGRGEGVCTCGTWLKHWTKSTGIQPIYCATTMCFRTADLGARVTKLGGYDRADYIVPLCDWCHKVEEEVEVNAILVPAGEEVFCRVAPDPLGALLPARGTTPLRP